MEIKITCRLHLLLFIFFVQTFIDYILNSIAFNGIIRGIKRGWIYLCTHMHIQYVHSQTSFFAHHYLIQLYNFWRSEEFKYIYVLINLFQVNNSFKAKVKRGFFTWLKDNLLCISRFAFIDAVDKKFIENKKKKDKKTQNYNVCSCNKLHPRQ